jgi:hypothetical protein
MNNKMIVFFGAVLTTFLLNINLANADACKAACIAVEVAGQTACVLEVFGEPECSIAVAGAFTACVELCGKSTYLTSPTLGSSLRSSDLCNGSGKVPVKNKKLANKLCKKFK